MHHIYRNCFFICDQNFIIAVFWNPDLDPFTWYLIRDLDLQMEILRLKHLFDLGYFFYIYIFTLWSTVFNVYEVLPREMIILLWEPFLYYRFIFFTVSFCRFSLELIIVSMQLKKFRSFLGRKNLWLRLE